MAHFLHSRISTADEVEALLSPAPQQEGPHLDFKEEWIIGAEAAKHVAAFANARGGDIVFGVAEDGAARAARFTAWRGKQTANHEESLYQSLSAHLRPRDFAADVQIRVVPRRPGGSTPDVLVISIPASAHLVGAADGGGPSAGVNHPVRVGRTTEYLDPGAVAGRLRTTARTRGLELLGLLRDGDILALFAPLFVEVVRPGSTSLNVRPHAGGSAVVWEAVEVGEQALTIRSHTKLLTLRPPGFNKRDVRIPAVTLTVPYDLIRSVWRIEDSALVNVMLDERVGIGLVEPGYWVLYLTREVTRLIDDESPDYGSSMEPVGPRT